MTRTKKKKKAKPVLFCPYALKGQKEALQYHWAGLSKILGDQRGALLETHGTGLLCW